jgi:hypothetical protein
LNRNPNPGDNPNKIEPPVGTEERWADKFTWQTGDLRISQCAFCVHKHANSEPPATCDAFPAGTGIPAAILSNTADHRQPYAGDGGIHFEPKPDTRWEDTGVKPS